MRETILLVDSTELICRAHYFAPSEMGMVILVAMHIAEFGPLPVEKIRQVARLRGRKQWLASYSEEKLFVRQDGQLNLCPDVFRVTERGSDRKRVNLSSSIREAVHERDGFICTYCGTGEGPFEVDHIVPVARGGGNEIENLCLACAPCNRAKSDKLLEEWVR